MCHRWAHSGGARFRAVWPCFFLGNNVDWALALPQAGLATGQHQQALLEWKGEPLVCRKHSQGQTRGSCEKPLPEVYSRKGASTHVPHPWDFACGEVGLDRVLKVLSKGLSLQTASPGTLMRGEINLMGWDQFQNKKERKKECSRKYSMAQYVVKMSMMLC